MNKNFTVKARFRHISEDDILDLIKKVKFEAKSLDIDYKNAEYCVFISNDVTHKVRSFHAYFHDLYDLMMAIRPIPYETNNRSVWWQIGITIDNWDQEALQHDLWSKSK